MRAVLSLLCLLLFLVAAPVRRVAAPVPSAWGGLFPDRVLAAESSQVCAGVAPAGYVTTAISGVCSLGMGRSAVLRTVRNTAGLPVNTRLEVCGPFTAPPGWALVEVHPRACFTTLGFSYLSGTMMNLNGLPSKTVVDICGLPAPAGWRVVTQKAPPCSTGATSYARFQITRL